jgi:hypothetical protein
MFTARAAGNAIVENESAALQNYRKILLLQSSNGSSVHLVKSYAGFSIAWSYLLFRPFGAL